MSAYAERPCLPRVEAEARPSCERWHERAPSARRRVGTARLWVAASLLALGACTSAPTSEPDRARALSWSELPGWPEPGLASAWPAFMAGCTRLPERDTSWAAICEDAALLGEVDDDIARAFFETRFVPFAMRNEDGGREGLVTGYYEPLLRGSLARSARYRYPVYRPPEDLVSVDLGALYPELKNRRVRGRLLGRRVVPYFERAQIDNGHAPLAGNELLWVDDPVALFFLQIQGSGRVRLDTGEQLHVGYADQNGHPYVAIGRRLVELGVLKPEEVELATIRDWLKANPEKASHIMNANPSYVFFALRDPALPGPLGSLGVPLQRERAIAVDPRHVALGSPVWLDTTLPDDPAPYRRLVFAHDTGGAIRGPVRADLFFGQGAQAERLAGRMKQPGRIYVLLPAQRPSF